MFDRRPPAPELRPGCPHCAASLAAAAAEPADHLVPCRGEFDACCLGCIARQIALSPAAWRAIRGGEGISLRDSIAAYWPGQAYESGRRAVWEWCRVLRVVRASNAGLARQ